MTAKTTAQAERVAGAASHDGLDWHAIDGRRVHQIVRRLQARIVKAIQEGRWGRCMPYNTCSPTRSVRKH